MNVALCPEDIVDPLNLLSICTGGGGLDLGFELAIPSARTVCMVEREAFAVAQLVSAMEAGLMAPASIWSDAKSFDGRGWRGSVDGLIGGIPCQPHSHAGRKRGSLDARDLWSDARRIIVQSRVWFILIENVGGMLSAGDDEIAGAERVHRDLHKLGFEVEAGLFSAAEVGAPHKRERIFILGVCDQLANASRQQWRKGGGQDATARARQGHQANLQDVAVSFWNTPAASDGERGGTITENMTGSSLAQQVRSNWQTPTVRDHKGGGTQMTRPDGKIRNDMLDWVAESWSTPRATDGEKGGPNQSFGAGGQPLPAQAAQWMTPRSHESGEYQYSKGDKTRPVPTLTGQACSHLGLTTVKTGKPHSKERRSLNPLFVEWLMGWPPGWTLLAWTDFACSETALSRFKQHMRSALLQLGLPAEAPPAQLALFG